jgi:hypothetical protein
MRVSILVADNVIVIDGKTMNVDLQALRGRNISAVQWYGELGEVEFAGHKQANQSIRSFKEFQEFVDRAKPPPDPKTPTPDELDAGHQAYLQRNPDALRPWKERDAAIKREAEMRQAEMQKGQDALASGTTAARPLPGAQPPLLQPPFVAPGLEQPGESQSETPKPKTKPKKK